MAARRLRYHADVVRLVLVALFAVGCGRVGFDATGGNGLPDDAAPLDDALTPFDAPPDASPPVDAPSGALVAALTRRGAMNPPSVRRSSGAAVASDDRIWIFGGFTSGGLLGDLAAYTPGTDAWAAVTGTAPPTARERHALAWDAANNVLVLFGGQSGVFPMFTHHDQLYLYAPATNAWTQIAKVGAWPAGRKDAAMVWVPHLGKLLMYGGNTGSGTTNRLADLWLLTVDAPAATASWALLSPGGVAAPAQSSGCVAYDPVGRRLILYGGETQDGNDVNTTYQYLLDTNAWQLDAPTGTTPPGESFAECAWDPVIGRVVLYGGQSASGAPIGGTHTYDPTAKRWDAIPLATGSASAGNRSDGGAVYSAALGGMFFFGGRSATVTYMNESWVVDVKAP